MRRDENDWNLDLGFGQLALEIEPANSRQANVQNQTSRHIRKPIGKELLGRLEDFHMKTDRSDKALDGTSDRRIIIDNVHSCVWHAHDSPAPSVGSVNSNVAPPRSGIDACSCPPWDSIMEWLIESPIPIPSDLVEKNGSKMRALVLGAIPGPESWIWTQTPSACFAVLIRILRRCSGFSCIASTAFMSRLINTCCNWIGSACTRRSSGVRSGLTRTRFRVNSLRSRATTCWTILLMSTSLLGAGSFTSKPRI